MVQCEERAQATIENGGYTELGISKCYKILGRLLHSPNVVANVRDVSSVLEHNDGA